MASAQARLRPAAASKDSAPLARYTDVQFMQGMIAHHAQALEMTALIATRTSREDFDFSASASTSHRGTRSR